jgi:hypothetical protein
VTVVADPRFRIPDDERQVKYDAQVRAGEMQETVAEAVRRIAETRSDIGVVLGKARHAGRDEHYPDDDERLSDPYRALVESGTALTEALDGLEQRFWSPPSEKGIGPEDDALSKIAYAERSLGSSWDAPTPAQVDYLAVAEKKLGEAIEAFHELYDTEVAEFRRGVDESGLSLLPESERLTLP